MIEQLPDTMRVSVLHGPKDLRIEERRVPEPAADQVLVQVGSVGVCGSDTHYFLHGRIGGFVVESPLVLGHEAGGRIVAVGANVPATRVGERVSLEPGVPCRRCAQCRRGAYNLCPDVQFFATPPYDGAFAEYVTLAADFAYPVPDELSDDACGLIEPLSVGVWANRKAGTGPGSRLLVSGAGPIGLLVTQVARAMGAVEVVVSDIDAGRRDLAVQMGATVAMDPRSAGDVADLQVDAFVDCSGVPAAVQAGIPGVRPGGIVVLVGMGADEMTLPVSAIQTSELTVTGTFRYANTWPAAIALALTGAVDLDSLVTGRVGLDRVAEALVPNPDDKHVKMVVRPGE